MCTIFSDHRLRRCLCLSAILSILFLCGCGGDELTLSTRQADGGTWVTGEARGVQDTGGTTAGGTQAFGNATAGGGQDMDGIWVDVCGEVVYPGVYFLKRGCRVYEAINLAGGLTEYACTDSMNLVDILSDGAHLKIPSYDTESEEKGTLININKADSSLLCTLPGIGETRAQAIIAYRTGQGGFSSCEQLMEVSGIGTSIYDRIRNLICV